MRRRRSERVLWLAIAVILAICAAGGITFSWIQGLNESSAWIIRTGNVHLTLQRTLSALQDAESSARGYLITHDEQMLEPFRQAHETLEVNLTSLSALTADNPAQRLNSTELARLARLRLQGLDEAVQAIRAGTFVLPPNPGIGEGQQRMLAVREQIARMQAVDDRLLAQRLPQASRAHKAALASAVSTSGISVALVLILLLVDRRASANIRRSEKWLFTTLHSIGDGVITTDAAGTIRFMNPVASVMTGWSQKEARGRNLSEVFHLISQTDRTVAENPVAQVLREGVVVGLADHALLVRRDGVEFPIEDSGAPIKDDDGAITGVVVVFKDATSERASQRALQASEERLRLALEGAQLGAMDHDLATGQAVWNERLYHITGFAPGTPVNAQMINLRTAPDDWPQVMEALRKSRAGRVPFQMEHRIVRANDNAVRWICAHGTFNYDPAGKPSRFIGVIRDITDQRRLEMQVRQSQQLDALGTLAGGIAHEFNNILAVLRGNLVLITGELPPEHALMPAIADMTGACNRATALVRQILTFGSRHEQDLRLVELEPVVREALNLLRSTLPAQIEIRSQFGHDLPRVLADPQQIQQVIANLGINAAQAIGARSGLIEVHLDTVHADAGLSATIPDVREGQQYLRLRVTDDGCGIAPQILERIFEPFFTTKEPSAGRGLGLSVARGILKNHRGAITVYSEPGRGARFNLYLPASREGLLPEAEHSVEPRRGRGERILYLDDEESLVVLAKRLLDRMGYQVCGFSDARAALAAFEADPGRFDLMLTDLSMPGISGMEVARKVLAVRPDIPVLLATGYVRPEDVEQARLIGIREVIWKPQTITEMGDVLAEQLQKLVPAPTE